ncbi:MAG: hypothetical protein RIF36_00450 [Imperialibacter sp.]|uniref:hypothetical protein n=1 Tax=Imperialibacter sp. TaxID=2038411 RepID=UPI0032EE487E
MRKDGSWKSVDRRAKTEVGSRKTEAGVGTVAMESARETVSRPKGGKTEDGSWKSEDRSRKTEVTNN